MTLQTKIYGATGEIFTLQGMGNHVQFIATGVFRLTGDLDQDVTDGFVDGVVRMLQGKADFVQMDSVMGDVELEIVPYQFDQNINDLFVLTVNAKEWTRWEAKVEIDLDLLDVRRFVNHFFFPDMIHFHPRDDGTYNIHYPNGYRDRRTQKV